MTALPKHRTFATFKKRLRFYIVGRRGCDAGPAIFRISLPYISHISVIQRRKRLLYSASRALFQNVELPDCRDSSITAKLIDAFRVSSSLLNGLEVYDRTEPCTYKMSYQKHKFAEPTFSCPKSEQITRHNKSWTREARTPCNRSTIWTVKFMCLLECTRSHHLTCGRRTRSFGERRSGKRCHSDFTRNASHALPYSPRRSALVSRLSSTTRH